MATSSRFIKVNGSLKRSNANNPTREVTLADGQHLTGTAAQDYGNAPTTRTLSPQTTTPTTGSGALPGATPSPYQAPTAPSTGDMFSKFMLDALKDAQGLNTVDLLKRKREIQREALVQRAAPVDKELRTLSPSQQGAIRSGAVSALSPEFDENAYQISKAEQQIANFWNVFDRVKEYGDEQEAKAVAPSSVIDSAINVIHAAPERLDSILAGFNEKSRNAILEKLDYTKLSPKTASAPVSLSEGAALVDPKTGEVIYKNPKMVDPKDAPGARVLSQSEASALGVPFGTTEEEAYGIDPSEVTSKREIQKQRDENKTTAAESYKAITGTLAGYGFSPETLTEEQADKLTDADAIAIGRSIPLVIAPEIKRQGGDPGNAFAPTSVAENIAQSYRAAKGGKQYLPEKIVDVVKNAVSIYKEREGQDVSGAAEETELRARGYTEEQIQMLKNTPN